MANSQNLEEIVEKLAKKQLKFYEVEKLVNGDKELATQLRARAVERMWGIKIPNIRATCIKKYPSMPASPTIGSTQIPLTIAGPVKINGDYAKGEFPVLLATTEGALTESVSRGCKIINANNGANTQIREAKVGISRAPCIKTRGVREAEKTREWINAQFEEIKEVVEKTDPFLLLKKIDIYVATRYVYPRFIGDSGDAMGMNMITIGAKEGVSYIIRKIGEKYGLTLLATSGNVCVDKKPCSLNMIEHVGIPVSAEITLKKQTIEDILKTTPDEMLQSYHGKNVIGSFKAGLLANNSQVANVVAAINCATGQDLAHIVEGSHTILDMQKEGEDLYVAVEIPALKIGTVGGGTSYPTMSEAKKLVGCDGYIKGRPGHNPRKLAEIIGVAVLAGEISLGGALTTRTLASTHKKIGR